jgi:hypothetical protein
MSDQRHILNYRKPERRKPRSELSIVGMLTLLLAAAYIGGIAVDIRSRSHRPPARIGPITADGAGQSQAGSLKPADVIVRPFPATQPDAP